MLIAAAWLDGKIQPEERQYLRQIAQEKGVAEDEDIKPWLYEVISVQTKDCYQWVKDYLGDNPSDDNIKNLMEAISGLVYSDGEVAVEEARLLSKLEQISQDNYSNQAHFNAILKQIQKLYRRAVDVHV
ncbi:MAG: TerB family tellurite resistance protein [Calothrix sp. SM1_7_51]|nr:TerB family tellurite resistance protein [Calothrix sp. SM1_7_51]